MHNIHAVSIDVSSAHRSGAAARRVAAASRWQGLRSANVAAHVVPRTRTKLSKHGFYSWDPIDSMLLLTMSNKLKTLNSWKSYCVLSRQHLIIVYDICKRCGRLYVSVTWPM
jgi:hypothetical protein